MAVEIKTKKWGNSVGIIIPNEIVEKLNIKPEEKVVVEIEKSGNVLMELFGTMKSGKTARQIVNEARRELESKWMQ